MRQKVTRDRILQFMAAFDDAKAPARIYLVGGVTAVLFDWRESTVIRTSKVDHLLVVIPKLLIIFSLKTAASLLI
jgi:hypothetical protein